MVQGGAMRPNRMRGKRAENYHYMADAMRRLEWDLHHAIEATGRIPLEWHEIAQDPARRETERVALRLDRDVMRFFRSMGMKPARPSAQPKIGILNRLTFARNRMGCGIAAKMQGMSK